MSDGIQIKGAQELEEKLRRVMERAPDRIDIQLEKMGRKLRKMSKDKTPVSDKEKARHLKDQYKLSQPELIPDGSGHQIKMYNTAPHFHLIEKGHKIVTTSGQVIGFVNGRFMVEKSVQELEEEVPAELEKWLDDLFKELML